MDRAECSRTHDPAYWRVGRTLPVDDERGRNREICVRDGYGMTNNVVEWWYLSCGRRGGRLPVRGTYCAGRRARDATRRGAAGSATNGGGPVGVASDHERTTMTERLRTDIEILDSRLGGGIPVGSIAALTASPASQSEVFLYNLTRARPTLYLVARRSAADVERALRESGAPMENVAVRELPAEFPMESAATYVTRLPDGVNLVVDPIDPFERGDEYDYGRFLNALKRRLVETDSVAFLHALDGRTVPSRRDTTEYMADVVFDLTTEVRNGDVENYLTVPKHRGGVALDESMRLELDREINVDITRRIA